MKEDKDVKLLELKQELEDVKRRRLFLCPASWTYRSLSESARALEAEISELESEISELESRDAG